MQIWNPSKTVPGKLTKKIAVTVTAIYHLPYSLRNKITNNQFLDQFMTHMTKLIPLHNNNIILGDFNLHLSNSDDLDAAVFNDTIEALGLYQHIHFTTHKSGNVLDLILSEISEKVNIKTVNPGPYISDHRATIATINVKKTRPKQEVIKIRKRHQITSNQWQKEYNEDVSLNPNLELVQSFNTELKWTLDKLAPEKETKLSLKTKCPWYSQEQKLHKAKVRRLEQKWLKHSLQVRKEQILCHT